MSRVRAIVLGCAMTASWLGLQGPLAVGPRTAHAATDEEKAGARALAEQAVEAFNDGEYERAVDLFRRAETLVHSPGHWLYMGRAYVKLGRLVLAQEAFLKAEREALNDSSPEAFRVAVADASSELEALRPRIAKVTVTVSGVEPSTASVTVDGAPVPSALIGVPMPVDPGERTFEVSAPGMLTESQALTIAEGGRESITLELHPIGITTTAPQEQPIPPPAQDAETAPNGAFLYAGIGAFVLGAGAVVGGYLNYQKGKPLRDRADELFGDCNPKGTCKSSGMSTRIDDLDSRAKGRWYTGIGLMGLGGLLLAGGTTLVVLSFQDSNGETALTVSPWATADSIGLNGTF